jgi:hypothetical protein
VVTFTDGNKEVIETVIIDVTKFEVQKRIGPNYLKQVVIQRGKTLTEGRITFQFAGNVTRQLYLFFQNPIKTQTAQILDLSKGVLNINLTMTERFLQCLEFRKTVYYEEPKKIIQCPILDRTTKLCNVNSVDTDTNSINVTLVQNFPVCFETNLRCTFLGHIEAKLPFKIIN